MKLLNTMLAVGLTAATSVAFAAPVVGNSSAVFSNVDLGTNAASNVNAVITAPTATSTMLSWGKACTLGSCSVVGRRNEVTFSGLNPFTGSVGSAFKIADITYLNGETTTNSVIKGAKLDLSVALTAPGSLSQTVNGAIKIDTSNPVGQNDALKFSFGSFGTFVGANGWTYEFKVLGFQQPGSGAGYTYTDLLSATETGPAREAGLFGIVSVKVPEPSSVALLGLGVLGLVGARRKKA